MSEADSTQKKKSTRLWALLSFLSMTILFFMVILTSKPANDIDSKAHELGRMIGEFSVPIIIALLSQISSRNYSRFIKVLFVISCLLVLSKCVEMGQKIEDTPYGIAEVVLNGREMTAINRTPLFQKNGCIEWKNGFSKGIGNSGIIQSISCLNKDEMTKEYKDALDGKSSSETIIIDTDMIFLFRGKIASEECEKMAKEFNVKSGRNFKCQ